MRLIPTVLAVLLLLLPASTRALQADKAFHHDVSNHWSIQQGLPQISALAITQDRQGYIWVGTQAGLGRFDGVHFTSFTPDSEPQLPGNWIRALYTARDGRIWIGTYKGVAVYDGQTFVSVPAADAKAWPTLDVSAFAEDAQGHVWVATALGLFTVGNGRLQAVAGSPVPAQSLLLRSDGLWVGGRGSVFRLQGTRWEAMALPADTATASVNRLLYTQGHLWAATAHGLFQRVGDSWQRYLQAPDLAQNPVDLLFADSDGNLWAGGDAGLARIRDGKLREYIDETDPGGIKGLRTAFEDRERNLWFGSQWEGLIRAHDSWITRLSTAEGLDDALVWSVAADPDGRRTWVGTNDGVSVFENGRFRHVVRGDALPHPHGYNLLAEAKRLWIGTRRGVAVLEHDGAGDGSLQQPSVLAPMAAAQINGIVRTADGDLWFTTSEGLFRLRGQSLRRYGLAEGLEPRTRFFLRTRSGRIFIGTQNGLFAMAGDRFVAVGVNKGLPKDIDVVSIVELHDGRLVLASFAERGYVQDHGHWITFGEAEGFPANAAFYMDEFNGDLWAAGIRGINRVPVADLNALAAGRIRRVRGEMLLNERGDPMRGEQGYCCNGAGNSKGFRRGATLWLPTRDGLVVLDTQAIVKNKVPPNVVIERVQVDNQWQPAAAVRGRQLPADARDLSFEFTVLSFQAPESNTVQYRLRGYDANWRAGDNLSRNARYTNLPPGDYVFEVRGYNNAGVPDRSDASLAFSIKPYFRETKAFLLLVGLALLALIVIGYRYERHRHRLQRAALENLVLQRTQALEVANRQLEDASHTDPLTTLRNRRYIASQMPADLSYYDRQILQGGYEDEVMVFALVDIDHFKSVNDRFGHKAGDMVLQQFAAVLGGLVRTGDYVVRWGGEEFLLVFRPMHARNLHVIGDRLRSAVAAHSFDVGTGENIRLTASSGLSEYPLFRNQQSALGWESMVELADQALYYVKSHGRDGWAAFRPTTLTDMTSLLAELQQGTDTLLAAGRLSVVGSAVAEPAVLRAGLDRTPT